MECPGVKLSWGCLGETIGAFGKVSSCHDESQGQVTLGPGAVPEAGMGLESPREKLCQGLLSWLAEAIARMGMSLRESQGQAMVGCPLWVGWKLWLQQPGGVLGVSCASLKG